MLCLMCKSELLPDTKYCSNCGYKINENIREQDAEYSYNIPPHYTKNNEPKHEDYINYNNYYNNSQHINPYEYSNSLNVNSRRKSKTGRNIFIILSILILLIVAILFVNWWFTRDRITEVDFQKPGIQLTENQAKVVTRLDKFESSINLGDFAQVENNYTAQSKFTGSIQELFEKMKKGDFSEESFKNTFNQDKLKDLFGNGPLNDLFKQFDIDLDDLFEDLDDKSNSSTKESKVQVENNDENSDDNIDENKDDYVEEYEDKSDAKNNLDKSNEYKNRKLTTEDMKRFKLDLKHLYELNNKIHVDFKIQNIKIINDEEAEVNLEYILSSKDRSLDLDAIRKKSVLKLVLLENGNWYIDSPMNFNIKDIFSFFK